MRKSRPGPLSFDVLQEFLEALDGSGLSARAREKMLLDAYAELRYHAFGGGRCALCNASVRHVLPVAVNRGKENKTYAGLCQRCLEGECGTADKVELVLGKVRWVLTRGGQKRRRPTVIPGGRKSG